MLDEDSDRMLLGTMSDIRRYDTLLATYTIKAIVLISKPYDPGTSQMKNGNTVMTRGHICQKPFCRRGLIRGEDVLNYAVLTPTNHNVFHHFSIQNTSI